MPSSAGRSWNSSTSRALTAHDLPEFFRSLATLFAGIPYDLTDRQNEQTWQVILTVILNFVGLSVLPEERTNVDRIDMSIRVEEEIYVVELKLDGTAPSALSQIVRNRYFRRGGASRSSASTSR